MNAKGCFTLAADHILPITSAAISSGWVRVEQGVITDLGAGSAPTPVDRDFGSAVIMPGLVNAHSHLGCSFLRHQLEDRPFWSWFEGDMVARLVNGLRAQKPAAITAAENLLEELMRGGVTCLNDSFFDDLSYDLMHQAGIRGVFSREYFGSRAADLDTYRAEAKARIAADCEAHKASGGLLHLGLAPHALHTCPPPVLKTLSAEAQSRGMRLTMHLEESREEHACFHQQQGPIHAQLKEAKLLDHYPSDKTPLEILADQGVLNEQFVLVHGVQLSPSDIELMAARGAHLVHCPSSNLGLGVGVAPLAELKAAGVNLALGTDSVASTGRLDMFEEMRLALWASRSRETQVASAARFTLDAAAVLEMATLGGARALGLDDQIGSLEAGKAADLCVLALPRASKLNSEEVVRAVVRGASAADVLATFVAGAIPQVFGESS